MLDYEIIFAVIFVIFLTIFLIIKRKKLALQKIAFPLLYIVLYRARLGINFMERASIKYREWIKLFGYVSIGVGFIGMIFIAYSVVVLFIKLIFAPAAATPGFVLVLPFTNIPGVGFLPFTHWIISIFILAVIHELAHGVVARAHDIEVKSSGFAFVAILLPIIPAAFVEPNEKKLRKEKDIVQYSILSAGPATNILSAFIFLLVMSLFLMPIEARITEPIGFSFDLTNETLPAALAGMKDKMIVTSFNNENVTDYTYFIRQLDSCIKPGENVTFGTMNGTFVVATAAKPEDETKPLVGISNIKNEARLKKGHEFWGMVYFWFRDLFKWLFLLNLFIGLANLLPLGIVDGGRMLQVALEKLVRDKKKAKKIWVYIAALFLVFIIFGLLVNYLGNPFALLW